MSEIRKKLHLDPVPELESKEAPLKIVQEPPFEIDKSKKETEIKQEVTHIVKPFISTFSGTDPLPQKQVCFDDWRQEINYLIKSSPYPDCVINQTIRNSLRGHARKVVNSMKDTGILEALQSHFGNVASGESIVQEFYNAYQKPGDSTTLWALRIKEIFQKAKEKGHVVKEQKKTMLKNKFWRVLYRTDLKNATHLYFVSDKMDYETLRKKVRAEEYEMSQERRYQFKDKKADVRSMKTETTEDQEERTKVEIQQQKSQQDSNTQILIDLAKDVKGMKQSVESNRNQSRSRGSNYRGRSGRGRRGSIEILSLISLRV